MDELRAPLSYVRYLLPKQVQLDRRGDPILRLLTLAMRKTS